MVLSGPETICQQSESAPAFENCPGFDPPWPDFLLATRNPSRPVSVRTPGLWRILVKRGKRRALSARAAGPISAVSSERSRGCYVVLFSEKALLWWSGSCVVLAM